MRYCAIDIETTGLDPGSHQVLEFAAVVETDWRTPVEELPSLRLLVAHGTLTGSPVALAMNARLVAELASPRGGGGHYPCPPELVGVRFGQFLREHFPEGERVTLAGKNAAGFDLPFLSRLPGWPADRFRHRLLDPGPLYTDPSRDDRVPDTAECLRRAGLSPDTPHEALADCRAVVQLLRVAYLRAGWWEEWKKWRDAA